MKLFVENLIAVAIKQQLQYFIYYNLYNTTVKITQITQQRTE